MNLIKRNGGGINKQKALNPLFFCFVLLLCFVLHGFKLKLCYKIVCRMDWQT